MRLANTKFFKKNNWSVLFSLCFFFLSTGSYAQGIDTSLQEVFKEMSVEETQSPSSSIYGHEIFKADYKINSDNGRDDSTKITIVHVPDSYVLGKGDKLIVSIFGESQFDAQLEVNQQGYIQPDRLPKIFLKGLTWGKAKKLIQSRFNQFYSFNSDQFAVSLGQPRMITVNIFGEVNNPGSFTLSAVNTAFNALFAAGGISKSGSIRNIKVISDTNQKELDIYELMVNPSKQFQFYLEDNMIIQVSSAQKIVEIRGAIKRPNEYELKGSEGLRELIQYTGGLRADALKEIVQIQRFGDRGQVLLDINWQELSTQNQNYALQNGDVITIKAIPKNIDNIVSIEGAVELPGGYAIQSTRNISSLLKKGILKKEARLDVAFLQRTNLDGTKKLIELNLTGIINNVGSPDDLVLEPDDKLLIYGQGRYVDKTTIKVSGAVRNALVYPFDPDATMTIQQAILLAGGLAPKAANFGYLIRTNPNNLKEKEYKSIDIKAALAAPTGANNIKLEPLDELVILTAADYTDKYMVSIKGAVRVPGEFQYGAALKITDLLTLGGGLAPEATDFGYLTRTNPNNLKEKEYKRIDVKAALANPESAANIQLEPLDELTVSTASTYTDNSTVAVRGAVRSPGQFQYDASLSLKDLLTLGGGFKLEAAKNRLDIFRLEFHENKPTTTNILTLELDDQLNIIAGAPADFSLMPYDEIVVRTVPDFELLTFVKVEGEVSYPGEYALISKNEPLSSVIKRAGGLTVEAFPEGATIYRSHDNQGYVLTELNKALSNEKSKFNYLLKEGDVITIPKKKDLVTIHLANTKAKELYPAKFAQTGTVGVAFQAIKSAKWYINEYVAGFGENASKKDVTVEYPNGAIKRTKNLLLFKKYPKLERGASISIGAKSGKSAKQKKQKTQKEQSKEDAKLLKIYPKLKKGTIITIGTEQEVKPVAKPVDKPVEEGKRN